MYPGAFKPTLTHFFIALLAQKKKLLRNWSQNIDTLEHLAGIAPNLIVNAHGSFAKAACIDCGAPHDPWETAKQIQAWKAMHDRNAGKRGKEAKAAVSRLLPRCKHSDCNGLVKPAITLYGEPLPDRFSKLAKTDFAYCDLLVVAGTSLNVQPFASLCSRVSPSTPRLLINREVVGTPTRLDGGFMFGRPANSRDVMARGDCDVSVRKLAGLLGWESELDKLKANFSMSKAMKKLRAFGSGKTLSKREKDKRRRRRKKAQRKKEKTAKKEKRKHDKRKKKGKPDKPERKKNQKKVRSSVDGDGMPTRVMRGRKKKLLGLRVVTEDLWETSGPQMPSPAKRIADLPLQLPNAPNCGM